MQSSNKQEISEFQRDLKTKRILFMVNGFRGFTMLFVYRKTILWQNSNAAITKPH